MCMESERQSEEEDVVSIGEVPCVPSWARLAPERAPMDAARALLVVPRVCVSTLHICVHGAEEK